MLSGARFFPKLIEMNDIVELNEIKLSELKRKKPAELLALAEQ